MNKKVLITGASKGIGLAITEKLLNCGCNVIGIARDFSKTNIDFEKRIIDLANLKKLPDILKQLVKDHSDIDALILNAGKGLTGNLEQYSYKQMQELINLNFLSATYVVRAFIPLMKQKGKGDIIFVSSTSGLQGHPKGSMYCASKFALRGFADSLREECVSSNIRVCTINPGIVKTEFFDDMNIMYGDEPCNYIEPIDIANTVEMVLKARKETVFREITVAPQKNVIKFKEKTS